MLTGSGAGHSRVRFARSVGVDEAADAGLGIHDVEPGGLVQTEPQTRGSSIAAHNQAPRTCDEKKEESLMIADTHHGASPPRNLRKRRQDAAANEASSLTTYPGYPEFQES